MVIQNPVINSTANIAAYMKLLMHFSPYPMHICPPEHSYIVPLSFFSGYSRNSMQKSEFKL